MGAIERSTLEDGGYYSHLFLRPKKDGTFRTILNLKQMNVACETSHFKMEHISDIVNLVSKDMYMASLDIRKAFYSVAIFEPHTKFLKFMHNGQIYKFVVLPNGYCDAMRIFCKLLKPAFSTLRNKGFLSIIYVDDTLLLARSYNDCLENIRETNNLLEKLGFSIHEEKSVFIPTRKITFLGFIVNSENMTLSLTQEKKEQIHRLGSELLETAETTIRTLASFIGKVCAAFEVTPMGRFHYRNLEGLKIAALVRNGWNYEANCRLNSGARADIVWWITNVFSSFRSLEQHQIDLVMETDASKLGWGATTEGKTINGRWLQGEQELHINQLELKAVLFAIKSFLPLFQGKKHVCVKTDNVTTLTYINKRGGMHSKPCNQIAWDIWNYCNSVDLHITATHIPGKHNVVADRASREFHDETEWKLNPSIFRKYVEKWGMPEVDLFASRTNHQIDNYISYHPDPGSMHIDAFTLNWNFQFSYAFPPFSPSVISRVLRKIVVDQAEVMLVLPKWSTQTWYPQMLNLLVEEPETISSIHLELPGENQRHPLYPKLKLLMIKVSGKRQ